MDGTQGPAPNQVSPIEAGFRVQTGIGGKAICSCLNAIAARADVRLLLDCALVELPESGQDPKIAMPELRPTTLITRAVGLPATVIDLETVLLPGNQGQYQGLARTSHAIGRLQVWPARSGDSAP